MTENLVLFCSFLRVTGITYKLGKGVGKGQKQPSMLALCLCSLWKYSWICFSELTVLFIQTLVVAGLRIHSKFKHILLHV